MTYPPFFDTFSCFDLFFTFPFYHFYTFTVFTFSPFCSFHDFGVFWHLCHNCNKALLCTKMPLFKYHKGDRELCVVVSPLILVLHRRGDRELCVVVSPLFYILFFVLLLCSCFSCRGDYTGEISFILSFSPLWTGFWVIVFGCFLFKFMSGRFIGEEKISVTLVLPLWNQNPVFNNANLPFCKVIIFSTFYWHQI